MAERDVQGRFTKGNGTTRKGSPNKAKKALEERVRELVEGNIALIKKDLKSLKPKDRIKAITDLMKYVLPAKRTVDSTINIENLNEEHLDRIINEILIKQKTNESSK